MQCLSLYHNVIFVHRDCVKCYLCADLCFRKSITNSTTCVLYISCSIAWIETNRWLLASHKRCGFITLRTNTKSAILNTGLKNVFSHFKMSLRFVAENIIFNNCNTTKTEGFYSTNILRLFNYTVFDLQKWIENRENVMVS